MLREPDKLTDFTAEWLVASGEGWGAPDEPSLLAQIVASADAGRARQAQAWLQLWEQTVRPLASRIKAKFGATISGDFVDAVGGLVWEKLSQGLYDWRFSAFPNWCYKVVLNAARDQYGQTMRGPRALPEALPSGSERTGRAPVRGQRAADVFEQVISSLAQLRQVLDQIAGAPALRAHVNYFAVLLVELRRGLVMRLRQAELLPGLGSIRAEWSTLSDSAVIELLLPWRQRERQLRFKPRFETIGGIWQSLVRCVDAAPFDLPAYVLRQRIIGPDGQPITQDCWYNWTRHLRRRLSDAAAGLPLIDSKTWADFFEPWAMGD